MVTTAGTSRIGHFDIAGPELEPLRTFYTQVFGWGIDVRGPGYALVRTPESTVPGALVEAPSASLIVGIVVPSLDRALEAVVPNGGTVVMPKTDNGFVTKAQVADPAGNRITLIQE
jgi:predicted enzyme related to lactoylglutathione lyase